jgi:hypothetical protein
VSGTSVPLIFLLEWVILQGNLRHSGEGRNLLDGGKKIPACAGMTIPIFEREDERGKV